jgi:CheY-like chemotaxis protein
MGGLQATRELRRIFPDPPERPSIVCLTANAMADDKARCIDAGADGYVSKPILVVRCLPLLLVFAPLTSFSSNSLNLSTPSTSPVLVVRLLSTPLVAFLLLSRAPASLSNLNSLRPALVGRVARTAPPVAVLAGRGQVRRHPVPNRQLRPSLAPLRRPRPRRLPPVLPLLRSRKEYLLLP